MPPQGEMPMEELPPVASGGGPQPSSIPPQLLSMLASQGTPLNNTQAM